MSLLEFTKELYFGQRSRFLDEFCNLNINDDAPYISEKDNLKYASQNKMFYDLRKEVIFGKQNDYGDIKIPITDKQFIRYVEQGYSSKQLFTILFAHWLGLSKTQLHLVSNRRYNSEAFLLHFLHHPQSEAASIKGLISEMQNTTPPKHTHLLFDDNNKVYTEAYYNKDINRLVSYDTGETFICAYDLPYDAAWY